MEKILIVDDNPKNIQMLGNILLGEGYELEYAENGRDAIDFLKEYKFNLVLMDVMMPVMNGFDACIAIKQSSEIDEVPIIFLTAKTDEESISKGFDVGGVDYITKPFNQSELLARVKTHLELKAGKDKLTELNHSLEQKVEQRTEQLRKAMEELEAFDLVKNEFLNIISHEIRTPLNGILGFSSLLKTSANEESKNEYLKMLDLSTKMLENFVLRALKISEIKTVGDSLLNKRKINVKNIIEVINNEFHQLLEDKEIKIRVSSTFEELVADENFLYDCLKISIENAISHSPQSGEIVINCTQENGSHYIEIEDCGDGFSKVFLTTGIKPFVSPNHINNNPGLDLYLCKVIVEAHGGDLSLRNDHGAVVRISLPNKLN